MMTQEPPAGVPVRAKSPARKNAQSLAVVDIDGGLLTLETVKTLTGIGKTKIYAMMAAGEFPQSVKVSDSEKARSVRWRSEEIREWMRRRGQG